jgi:hypothetical protein
VKDSKGNIKPLPNIANFYISEQQSEFNKIPTQRTSETQLLMQIPSRITHPITQANAVVPIFVQSGTVILSQVFPMMGGIFF